MSNGDLSRAAFRRNVILTLALGMSGLFLWMIHSFIAPLFLAAISSALLHPVYRWVTRHVKHRLLGGVLTVVLVSVVLFTVVGGLLALVARQALELGEILMPQLNEQNNHHAITWGTAWLEARFPVLEGRLPETDGVVSQINDALSAASGYLLKNFSRATAGAASFVLKAFVMLYAMYFFLVDGKKILERARALLPLAEDEKDRVFGRFVSVTRATLKGSLLIGVLQGGLCGAALWMLDVEGWAFLSIIMLALSVIQGIGPPLVWVPALFVVYSRGQEIEAVVAAVWCGAVVGSLDNILRPHLVGKDAKMPDLMILVGTLGGIAMFGLVGLIVGPIICALFLAVWDIYRIAFRKALDPQEGGTRIVTSSS